MKFFVCLLLPEGDLVPDRLRDEYEAFPRARGIPFRWQAFGPVAVLLAGTGAQDTPLATGNDDGVTVGIVRLDNRRELELWSHCNSRDATDLEILGRIVLRHNTKYVPAILGDFAFVAWNSRTRAVLAACDALSVKKLYWAQRNDVLVFASRAEALALQETYEVQYLAERIAGCNTSPGLTPYRGVSAVPGGTMMLVEDGRRTLRQFWSAYEVSSRPVWSRSEQEAVATCRTLLAESVRLRLGGSANMWAQLSGGMDSSSVVSMVQWLAERGVVAHGLAGTVTYVDLHGAGGDERRYAQPVAQRWGLRHEVIFSPPAWQDGHVAIPMTDEPTMALEGVGREDRVLAVLRGAGATVMLTGSGGDVLFAGTMFFFADWVARGHVWAAAREIARRAVIGRASFWELAYRNAVLPLLPRALRRRIMDEQGTVPQWIDRTIARRYGLYDRATAPELYAGRIGHKYRDAAAAVVASVSPNLTVSFLDDHVDLRHPFYYRPLVEFALSLPPELCVQPHARKWVLRQAMTGILPEVVRTRIGKGAYDGAPTWALATQSAALEPLVRESILVDLGLVDARKLRIAFDAGRNERESRVSNAGMVLDTLSVEAWLQARSGRWPRGSRASSAVASN
jgi:asparagine synthase (glutamine-hydrolysing)